MEAIISDFINEIKDYISDDKINQFKKVVRHFEKVNSLKLNIEWEDVLTEVKNRVKVIPTDLKQRLFEIFDVEEVKFKINNESSEAEIVDTCIKILKPLDDIEKRNKGYYYNLGYLLTILKSKYSNEKEFLAFAKEKFNRRKSVINDYIRLFNSCNQHSSLLNCNLSYREIIKNLPEIKEIILSMTNGGG